MLLPEMEDQIRTIFQVEDFLSTGYTSNETGAIGFRCRHLPPNHFHLHENMQLVSLTAMNEPGSQASELKHRGQDDSFSPPPLPLPPVPEGETGKIIATNLNRTLMPLLRYEIGDMGRFIPRSMTITANGDKGGICHCGRRLRVLQLLGRCDARIRLGTEDLLYLEQIPRCIQAANKALLSPPSLLHPPLPSQITLSAGIFSLEVTKSPRQFDHLTLHVQVSSGSGSDCQETEYKWVRRALLLALGQLTQLVWEVKGEEQERWADGEDDAVFVAMMRKKLQLSEACMERPQVVVHRPHTMPRNPRTGKIVLLQDRRGA